MTLDDLKADPRYVTLPPSRREFVLAYCSNGADKVAAAKASSEVTTEESAISKANTVMRDPAVRALVNAFYNRTEDVGSKTEALAIVWKQIQTGGEDLLDYLKLYGEWMGFKSEKGPDEPPKPPDLYDQVRELEKQEKK